MKRFILSIIISFSCLFAFSRGISVSAENQPMAEVFRIIMDQSGKNFVYQSELLADKKVTLNVKNLSLKKTLKKIFDGTDISFKIKGSNVVLTAKTRRPVALPVPSVRPRPIAENINPKAEVLKEIVVVSRLGAPEIASPEMGATKLTAADVLTTPVLFGEADVIKALHTLPGVTEGNEGLAGMMVHGGAPDENLYLLDNVPVYQINHFGGIFSAFNVDALKHIDFFKTSIPAKYDGRLSSVIDVRTADGDTTGHHGSGRLGLTSGAFNISGPIGKRTTYMGAVRRSWFDVITVPVMSMLNSMSDDEKISFGYNFTDLNAKVTHHFSDRTSGILGIYYGEDYLRAKDKTTGLYDYSTYYDDKHGFRWGNLVINSNVAYRFSPTLNAEFTGAFTRYFGTMKVNEHVYIKAKDQILSDSRFEYTSANHINDLILRSDFDWRPFHRSVIRFGAGYTFHSFLPSRSEQKTSFNNQSATASNKGHKYNGSEFNGYIEDDWSLTDYLRMNGGLHFSIFSVDKKTHVSLSPRLAVNWRFTDCLSLKAAYTRTNQYVHQLSRSYLSLPTDQWIPITGGLKPSTTDKIGTGLYWQTSDGQFTASVEGYYKTTHNLVDYLDEYYLASPLEPWDSRLTVGKGSSKGIDFMVSRTFGKVTGHVSYSLSRTDRTFPEKNGGLTYLARYDIPHSINILLNWQISGKVALNANWTGHSGNRFTFMTGTWQTPDFDKNTSPSILADQDWVPLKVPVNNYRLPFYHRLDLSLTVTNSRGYWNFGLYNAYNHLNTIAIRRSFRYYTTSIGGWNASTESRPVFQKVCLLPLIPSISYTWQF